MLIQNSIHTLISMAQAYEASAFRGDEVDRLLRLRDDLNHFHRDLMIDLSALTNVNHACSVTPYNIILNAGYPRADCCQITFGLSGRGLFEAVLKAKELIDRDTEIEAEITIRFGDHREGVPTDRVAILLSRTAAKGQLMADCETYVRACLTKLRKLPA